MIAMKPIRRYMMIMLCLILCSSFPLQGDQGTLAELYRSGKVRLVSELVIDEKSLPKDVLFVGLTSISSDSAGNIYALDMSDNNIKKFDSAGRFIKVIGRNGQGPGEFDMPYKMGVAGDRLVVYEMMNMRLSLLTLDGTYISGLRLPDAMERPEKIRGLPGGDVILETEKIYFEKDRPQDRRIAILDSGLKHKKEIYSRSVLRDIYSLSHGNLPQPFCHDIHWDVSPDGHILIGFSDKYEIGIFDAENKRLGTVVHAWDPAMVTAEDKKNWFGNINTANGKGAPDWVVKATKFPSLKPAFDEVLWDPDGNIIVHPILQEGSGQFYDAFAPDGTFIARFELAGAPELFHERKKWFSGSFFWTYHSDSEGNYHILRWRLSKF